MPSGGGLSLKARALRLLSMREHSRAELERKLASRESEPGQLARTLDDLQARGFICEQRVVESVLHQRAARVGSNRIRHELQAKGLTPQAVRDALAVLRSSELERAHAVWARKFATPAGSAAERARQARFLLARGFAADVVHRIVSMDDPAEMPESPTDPASA